MLDRDLLLSVLDLQLQEAILEGHFGLEKENIRVEGEGQLALTPHPKAFGSKTENPYIKTDFSESQLEMVTPVFDSIDETYHFMETLHDMVTLELRDEYLWPSSNPPLLPPDQAIPIAQMNDPDADKYREQLADKYGRKRQLMSGIHYNFSFRETFLQQLYNERKIALPYKDYKDSIYLKVTRNALRYRWLLIYLTGASPVFNKTYIEQCVRVSKHLDEESFYFPNMNSLRNSVCGYRNKKPLFVSFDTVDEYVRDLRALVQTNELLSVKEFYSPVRIKPEAGNDFLEQLQEKGISYLELRMIDLNPLYKIGISKQTMQFIHLFLVFMLLIKDEPFGEAEQQLANQLQDRLIMNGMEGMQETALALLGNMEHMLRLLMPNDELSLHVLEQEKQKINNKDLSFAEIVKADIQQSSYLSYHMDKAKQYAKMSLANSYQLKGYEDMELSTQLLLKAAIKRGIDFDIIDREDNFVVLTKGNQQEYVKQATKTSLDSYSSVLTMENKIVTKKVLEKHGIRVPRGKAYRDLNAALVEYEGYRSIPIVVKPKSTNFGLGVTIFAGEFSLDDYQTAFEMAFTYDKTVLLEEFMSGKEYRFLVMGDEVVGILHRVPANVAGDGIHTIEELVTIKNKDPLRGQGYRTPLERIQIGEVEEMFLRNQSKSRTDIPHRGEVVYLRENSNISTGGDSIDYTDVIPTSYKSIAIQAAGAAGAKICGVDMMIDNVKEEANAANYSIIELNFNPAIHIHDYPYEGIKRNAAEKILDLLFGGLIL